METGIRPYVVYGVLGQNAILAYLEKCQKIRNRFGSGSAVHIKGAIK